MKARCSCGCCVTATWSVALAAFSKQLPLPFSSRVLGVLGIISAGFALSSC